MFPAASPAVVAGLGNTQNLPFREKNHGGRCTPQATKAGQVLNTNSLRAVANWVWWRSKAPETARRGDSI